MRPCHSLSILAVGIFAAAGCQSLERPRFVSADHPAYSPVAPLLRGTMSTLREPRYVKADRPEDSPITPLLQNRSPWSKSLFAKQSPDPAPFSPVAPALRTADAASRSTVVGARPERGYMVLTRPLPHWNRNETRPSPLFADTGTPTNAGAKKADGHPTKAGAAEQTAKVCWASAEDLAKHDMIQDAIRQFHQAVECDPTLAAKAAWQTAKLHDKNGQSEKACRAYQTALQDNPNNADLLTDIGQFYFTRGGAAESERWFRMALEREPKHERATKCLGIALGSQGKKFESARILQGIPAEADAHVAVGDALSKIGKNDDAMKCYRKALELEPDHEDAQSRIDHAPEPELAAPAPILIPAIRATGKSPF